MAEGLYPHDDAVNSIIKAAVAGGVVSDTTWAGNLVGDESTVFADFAEFLRPMTVLGKFGAGGIPSLRRVPFRTRLLGQTTGGEGYWVGEGAAKPLTSFDFSSTSLTPLKVANIAVLSMEVLRDPSPSAEMLVRDQLAAALSARLDVDFIDPDKSASANVSPASITNGITPITSTGNDADDVREDVRAIKNAFITANNPTMSGVWIMSAQTAMSLSLMVNALGQTEFPDVNENGGRFMGYPVITSEYVTQATDGHIVILANASDVYFADEGGIQIDVSREASLQMDDAPTNASGASPTGTSVVSLWQTNAVGMRAERTLNWARRRSTGVNWIQAVNWGEAAS